MLREQTQTLVTIAARVRKIEELSPALESIGKSLAAIEMYLRDIAKNQGMEPRPDSAANRRQKTG